jgi:hypothetical protein
VYVVYHTPLDASAAVAQLDASTTRLDAAAACRTDPPAVTRTLLCEVPTPRPCYMHSFAMSSSYIVLSESPVHIDLLRMFTAPFTGAASFPLPANTRRSDPSFASCRRHHRRVFRL